MSLVTPAQVKQDVAIKGTAEDQRLQEAIDAAEILLVHWFRLPVADDGTFSLETKTYTEHIDGPDLEQSRYLQLTMRPVIAVTTIHQSTQEIFDAGTLLVSGTDYDAPTAKDLQIGRVLKTLNTESWFTGFRAIQAVFTAGWGASGAAARDMRKYVGWQVQYLLRTDKTGAVPLLTQGGMTRDDDFAHLGIDPRVLAQAGHYRIAERLFG